MSDLVELLLCPFCGADAKRLREQSEFVIDVLESNARVQAKLLADTGRERDELKDILKKVTNALNEEYYDHFELKDLAEELRSLLEVKEI